LWLPVLFLEEINSFENLKLKLNYDSIRGLQSQGVKTIIYQGNQSKTSCSLLTQNSDLALILERAKNKNKNKNNYRGADSCQLELTGPDRCSGLPWLCRNAPSAYQHVNYWILSILYPLPKMKRNETKRNDDQSASLPPQMSKWIDIRARVPGRFVHHAKLPTIIPLYTTKVVRRTRVPLWRAVRKEQTLGW
jgi:hypothetical protein